MSSDIPFDRIILNEPLGPVITEVSERAVERYCEDWDDHNPLYLKQSPWGGPIVPPAFQSGLIGFRLLSTRYQTRATIGAKTEHRSIRPAHVGARLSTRGTVSEKYVRRGLEYVVVDSETHDDAGQLIRESRDHILLSIERQPSDDEPAGRAGTSEARRSMLAAEPFASAVEIPSLHKRAYQRALDESRFSDNSIHNDEYTKKHGYAGALMSAYVLCGYMTELLVNFFGPSFLFGGFVSLTFINGGVQQGDLITCRGRILETAAEKEGLRHELAVWMEKDGGRQVVVGRASGLRSQS